MISTRMVTGVVEIIINGADDETRTRDPNLGKVVLYQLSYVRITINLVDDNGFEPPTSTMST